MAIANLTRSIFESIANGDQRAIRFLEELGLAAVPAGGTVGQTLVKNTLEDWDYSWQNASGGGGGGPATWGSITGSLSAQLDLVAALADKQDTLVSGTTIKTLNGTSILGAGDLTIPALTDGDKGDIIVSGSGASWVIESGAVTLAKMANLAASTFMGNNTGAPTAPLALSPAQAKSLLAIVAADVTDFDTAVAANSAVLANTAKVTNATHTGDVTGSGALTIANGAVSLGKMANLAANSIIGNNTGTPTAPIALTQAQVTAMLDLFSNTLKGLVPPSGGGTTNFLRADATWAAPGGGGGTPADIQNFTTAGSATWTKPAGARYVHIIMHGGGGGGGGGRLRADTVPAAGGGAGGAPGSWNEIWVPASLLGATVSLTVGAGGTAGAGRTGAAADGGAGGTGGDSIFGTWRARGGPGGNGGTAAGGTSGGTSAGIEERAAGSLYSKAGAAGSTASGTLGNRGGRGAGGGAGGSGHAAGVTTAIGGNNGGLGGSIFTTSAGTTGGGANGGASAGSAGFPGADATDIFYGGDGGGSGANGGGATNGGAGGNGGFPGGGAGGGGATTVANGSSGAGGTGGRGAIRVTTFF
jgi:hypothetical protein